jgi:hypothetical protein
MPSRPPRASDAAEKSKAAPAVKLPPAVAQQKAYAQSIADLELPKTSLVKLAKGSVRTSRSGEVEGEGGGEMGLWACGLGLGRC